MNKFLSRLAQLVIDIVSFADYKLIRHIKKIVPYASASDVTKMLYDQAKLDMGFTNSGVSTICAGYPDLFISFYSIGRENFLIGDLDRKYKETMLAVWSQAFSCNYCLGMHAIFVDSLCDENIIAAIVSDRPDLIQDETVRAYALWARQIVKFREAPPLNAPFLPRYLPEILSLLVANAVYGRLANIFLRASPLRLNSTPIMQWALSILRPGIKTLVPTLTRGILLPITTTTTHPPTRLDWAKGDPISHKILHAFDEAIARYVDPLLTPSIRAEAQRAFYKWTEEEPPLGREWLNEFSANLGASEQAKLKYVICAGLTPLRLSAKEIDEQSSGDAALFLALWACFNVGLQLAERVGLRAQLNR